MGARGAWYASGGSKLRELYTVLHLPYTSMVLSYLLIGADISPTIYPDRVVLTLLAYFLGLGLSAHALNELHTTHWVEVLGRRELIVLFALPLVGAVVIGVYGMVELEMGSGSVVPPLVLMVFMFLEVFFLIAYNTDAFGGAFHSDVAFALSWAALPTLVSYYVNSLMISVGAILVAVAMAATAGIEINLSRWCKEFRRKSSLTGMWFADGSRQTITTVQLLAKPERALKLIVVSVDLVALGLIAYRLLS